MILAEAAATHAPKVCRLFGDKDGLLEAVAEHVLATYVSAKSAAAETAGVEGTDPVADLRRGRNAHFDLGLANPALFALLARPGRTAGLPSSAAGLQVLRTRVRRVAAAGRLRVGERRMVEVLHDADTGAVSTLLAQPPHKRELDLAQAMWSAAADLFLTDAPPGQR